MPHQNDNQSNIEGSDFLKIDSPSSDEVTNATPTTEEMYPKGKKSKYGFNKDDRWKDK